MIEAELPKHIRLHRISTLQSDWTHMVKVVSDNPGMLAALCEEAGADIGDCLEPDFTMHILPVTHRLSNVSIGLLATGATNIRMTNMLAPEYNGEDVSQYFTADSPEPFRGNYIRFLS